MVNGCMLYTKSKTDTKFVTIARLVMDVPVGSLNSSPYLTVIKNLDIGISIVQNMSHSNIQKTNIKIDTLSRSVMNFEYINNN